MTECYRDHRKLLQEEAKWVVSSAALANQESIQESKLRAVRQAVDTYRGRLGLEFRKGAGFYSHPLSNVLEIASRPMPPEHLS